MKLISKADINAMDQRVRATMINCLWGYRSAWLVGTQNADGVNNLAIFNSIFHLGAHPAMCGMVIRPDSVARHTLANIRETGEYTLNSVHIPLVDRAHQTSARYSELESEFEAVGLTPRYFEGYKAPCVAESQINILLSFEQEIPVALNGTLLVLGKVEAIQMPENCLLADGFLDYQALNLAVTQGLDAYMPTSTVERFAYAKPNVMPKKLRPS